MGRIVGAYASWLLAALVGVLIVLPLVPAAASVGWPVLPLMFVVTVLLAVSIFVHNRRLCERCIASMPLDAAAVASRYAVRFRIAHLFEHKLIAVCYLAGLIGCSLLSTDPVGRYGWAVAQASLVYLLLVYGTHQRLQPWCPQCRNGGGGRAPPPAPSPGPPPPHRPPQGPGHLP